jgi:hypothetical protein
MRPALGSLEEIVEAAIDDIRRAGRDAELDGIVMFTLRLELVVEFGEEELEELVEGIDTGIGERIVFEALNECPHVLDWLELGEGEWLEDIIEVLV